MRIGFVQKLVQRLPGILVEQQIIGFILNNGRQIAAGHQQAVLFGNTFGGGGNDLNVDAKTFLEQFDGFQTVPEGHVLTIRTPDSDGDGFLSLSDGNEAQGQQRDCQQKRQETGYLFHGKTSF